MLFNRLLKGNRCQEALFLAHNRGKINFKLFGVCKHAGPKFWGLFCSLNMGCLGSCPKSEEMVDIQQVRRVEATPPRRRVQVFALCWPDAAEERAASSKVGFPVEVGSLLI